MKICTICDSSYLLKALCLYHSLCNTIKEDFILYWLCLDDEIYNKLSELNFKNVELFKLSDLEAADPELMTRKNIPFVSEYGDEKSNYIWSLTPYFINYLLKTIIEDGEQIMYIDSDIVLYKSPRIILDAIGDKSLGIHTHRPSQRVETNTGHYNVGIMVFRKDKAGMYFSDLWKSWLLNPYNEHAEKHGTCGDQKYVELAAEYIGRDNICVFDEDKEIYHGAPWCANDLEGKEILFYHFSHFVLLPDNDWRDSLHGEWNPALYSWIRPLYEQYFEQQQAFKKKFFI